MIRLRLARQSLIFAGFAMLVSACGGGGGSPPTPRTTPTAVPSTTPAPPEADFQCPGSDSTTSFASSAGQFGVEDVAHRSVRREAQAATASSQIAVEYDTATLNAQRSTLAMRTQSLNASLVRELSFAHVARSVQILNVNPAQIASTMQSLRALPGVRSVAQVQRSRALAAQTWTNDPYFNGFTTTVPTAAPPTPGPSSSASPIPGTAMPPATYHVAPYEESADVPGQWDMHTIGLEYAFGVSEGASSTKLAIIDTGEDTSHPELVGKIVAQGCFISDTKGKQSTSNFTTDPDGHGTDVSGIAVANLNNDLGFVGVGGDVSLMAYRVFPTPDQTCDLGASSSQEDDSCSTNTVDIADAINAAVEGGANVISMSLGSCCGADTPPESTAVANAIAANVIVVAAAGNDNNGNGNSAYVPGGAVATSLEAPGNDPGVIAVGATSLDDGQPNGASKTGGNAGGTATKPVEYIADYSDYATPNTANGASSWGIVAPGGDAIDETNVTDNDDLHWVENIWTSTPYDASDAGTCKGDYPGESATVAPDCRIDIDGTSMATPHVAGAAALIIALTGSKYQNPAAMKQLLCQTADPVSGAGQGCGRLDIFRALTVASGQPDPGQPANPY